MKNIFRITVFILFTSLSFFSSQLFAHGEDKVGPHGGYLRMPGAFHTEVVPRKSGFEIFLLDMDFKHPVINDSSVNAIIKYDSKSVELKCKTESNAFFCEVNKSLLNQATTLEILAVRQHSKGVAAIYPLPLKHK